ncbi:MAG: tyrosine-type recombinase/integrase [Leptospiraceae bacterium]|nr:tyrosine-type recombinase/integrase [Leptospiraceae bacterium]
MREINLNELNITHLPKLGVKRYDSEINKFNNWNSGQLITRIRIKQFIETLFENKHKPNYINGIKNSLKLSIESHLLDNFLEHSIYGWNLYFKRIRTKQQVKTVKPEEILSKKELDLLIKLSPERESLIIETFRDTGLRLFELLALKRNNVSSVKTSNGIKYRIASVVGKRGYLKEVILLDSLYKRIIKFFKSTEYLFERKPFKAYSKRLVQHTIFEQGQNVLKKRVTPHLIRHSAENILLDKTKDRSRTAYYFGHLPGTMDKTYIHLTFKPEQVAVLLNKIYKGDKSNDKQRKRI